MPNTVRLHRVLATKPDKIYRAFIEADAMAKWLPPNGFACTVHHLEGKVGATKHGASVSPEPFVSPPEGLQSKFGKMPCVADA